MLKGGETRHCQDSHSLSVCVCFLTVFPEPRGLHFGMVKEKQSPVAISVKEPNRLTLTFPENFTQCNRV